MKHTATICSLLTALFLTPVVGIPPAVAQGNAQSGDIVVDTDGQATPGQTVDCEGAGTNNVYTSLTDAVDAANSSTLASIYICPGTYGPDENVEITASLEIKAAGADEVTIEATSQDAQPEALRIVSGVTGVEMRDFRIVHSSNGQDQNAATIALETGVDGIEMKSLAVERQGALANTAAAVRPNGTNVEIANCDISGGPIGSFGTPNGNYTLQDNTIRGAGDEAIWIVDGNEITVTGNTLEATPQDQDPEDDWIGIAIYNAETSLILQNNDATRMTRAPLLLGGDLPMMDPATGSVVTLTTAAQMRSIVLAANSFGPVAFLSTSDASTLRSESGNVSQNGTGVHVVRRTITTAPGTGGSSAYGQSAYQAAAAGDVVQLTDGASYDETVSVAKTLGVAMPTAASIQAIALDGGLTLSVPSGTLTLTDGLTLGLESELTGTPLVLGPQATLTDNGLSAGRLRATRTVAGGESSDFGQIGLALSSNGGTGPGEVTVTRIDGEPVTKGDGSIRRLYDVQAATDTGLDVDLGIEYDDGSNGGDDELTSASVSDAGLLGVFRSTDTGETWAELSNVQQNLGANTFTVSGLSQLSQFTLAASGGTLPVELSDFHVRSDGTAAILAWTTVSETNNAGFRVQKETDAGFQTIGSVDGAGSTTETTAYRYRVSDLDVGSHTFRLQQVDQDGTTSLSAAMTVDIRLEGAFEVSSVRPNPVAGQGAIDVAVSSAQPVRVELFDALGRQVRTLNRGTLKSGTTHRISLQAGSLPSGHYYVRVRGEQFQVTRRLVVVR